MPSSTETYDSQQKWFHGVDDALTAQFPLRRCTLGCFNSLSVVSSDCLLNVHGVLVLYVPFSLLMNATTDEDKEQLRCSLLFQVRPSQTKSCHAKTQESTLDEVTGGTQAVELMREMTRLS